MDASGRETEVKTRENGEEEDYDDDDDDDVEGYRQRSRKVFRSLVPFSTLLSISTPSSRRDISFRTLLIVDAPKRS